MAIKKIMGSETEYGIIISGSPIVIDDKGEEDPSSAYAKIRFACKLLISSFPKSQAVLRKTDSWDYELESPIQDVRGPAFTQQEEELLEKIRAEMERKYGRKFVLHNFENEPTDFNRILKERLIAVIENEILTNGSRFYIDHAHPEYSTPECSNARDVVIWEKGGEKILNLSMIAANQNLPAGQEIIVYKDNTDRKGASYGAHENYLISRKLWNYAPDDQDPQNKLKDRYLTLPIWRLLPFIVTRQIICGSGKIGIEADHQIINPYVYQISQRADFMETTMSVSTVFHRPLINTRDEPHADAAKYHRLHMIAGDANMSEFSIWIKMATTAIVLMMMEDDFIVDVPNFQNPVKAVQFISRDLTCKRPVALQNGEKASAIDIQRWFWNKAKEYAAANPTTVDAGVIDAWDEVLAKLAEDPMSLDRKIDWVIKKRLLDNELARWGSDWKDYPDRTITIRGEEQYLRDRIKMMDVQYHDIRPEKGIYCFLESCGEVDRLVTDDEIDNSVFYPPEDTRAYFRGNCVKKYRDSIVMANWDSLVFRTDSGQPDERVMLLNPEKGTKALTAALLESCPTAKELLAKLKSKEKK